MDNRNELFGKRLKQLRKKTGKSQLDIATELGISRARYSHYENNHVEPDIELIRKLADYHNVTSDYLLGRSSDPRITEQQEKEIDKKTDEILKLIENMPEERQKIEVEKILAYTRGLADANDED